MLILCTGLWLFTGVSIREVALYLLFIGLWITGPGILLWWTLGGCRRSLLESIAVGIPLGYAVVVLSYIGVVSLGRRGLALYIPPVIGLACALYVGVRSHFRFPHIHINRSLRPDILCVAAIAIFSLAISANRFFPASPVIPDVMRWGANYPLDTTWHIGNGASLKYFWPFEDLRAVGTVMQYHLACYVQVAVASLATGLEISTLQLRLDPVFWTFLYALELYWMGRELTGSAKTALFTTFLLLCVSDLTIIPLGIAKLMPSTVGTITGPADWEKRLR